MNRSRVVVGADGSQASHAAVRWAAAEAVRRGCQLLVVFAHELPFGGDLPISVAAARVALSRDGAAQRIIADAVEEAQLLNPELCVRGEAVVGHPAATLLSKAHTARLLVVGDRGRGGFARLLLGSVGSQVSAHATGPVVIVRGATDRTDGPVVVGVDDSPAGEAALAAAFDAAAARGRPILAVRAWQQVAQPWRGDLPPLLYDTAAVEAEATLTLNRALAGWGQKYPDTTIITRVAEGDPGRVLARVSAEGQLLVVGSHAHRPVSDLLLGSTSRYVSHHAACPVLLTRPAHQDG